MRLSMIAIGLCLAACGGATPQQSDRGAARTQAAPEAAPEAVCTRMFALRDEHCPGFTNFDLEPARCAKIVRIARERPANTERLANRALGRCVMSNQRCDEVNQCTDKIVGLNVETKRAPTAQVACGRLHGALEKCGTEMFGKNVGECVAVFQDNPVLLQKSGHCYVDEGDDCERVSACMGESAVDPNDLRACSEYEADRAAGLFKADWARRNGAGVTKLASAHSTKDAPIEVCGFVAENEWLFAATCNNGSHPITTRPQAEASRTGNEGRGGRCGSIIDRYRVKCPEATYDIHIDAYVCAFAE